MRAIDVIKQKKRFEMFSENTKEQVLELNTFFGKYLMHFEEKVKKQFTYYDTPNHDLEKSNILLFKIQIGKFTEINMMSEKINRTYRYATRSNYKHFKKQIRQHDSLMKHKDFLIESFKSMFISSVNFDPEFLLQKLQVSYIINTTSMEYRSTNGFGLKITYSFDKDEYISNFSNQKATADILTIYQHSNEKTNPEFEDLLGKLTRYCKELTPMSESKIQIARRMTKQKENESLLNVKKAKK